MGVMAGTVDLVRCGFAGIEPGSAWVSVDPRLPPQLATLRYSLLVGGARRWLGGRTFDAF